MILDDRTYGIQAFDTPEEAFGLMAFHWTDRSYERMFVLNDRQFIKMIGERIIRIVVETMLGRVSKEKCKESLGLENAINDYLLDWNFFLYSSVNNRYYTSFMEYKADYCHVWCDRQWELFWELHQTYRFDEVIDGAFRFLEDHQYLIDEYGGDGLEIILDEYWSGS
jgi:hypothetical protein